MSLFEVVSFNAIGTEFKSKEHYIAHRLADICDIFLGRKTLDEERESSC